MGIKPPRPSLRSSCCRRPWPDPEQELSGRRYHSEFVAELFGLRPALSSVTPSASCPKALALRAALGASPRGIKEAAMTPVTFGQRFRCRYLHWHHSKTFTTPDGQRYSACAVCRKEHDDWGSGPTGTTFS